MESSHGDHLPRHCLLAYEFGGDVSCATSAVYCSTVISLVTTTVNLMLLRMWVG
jgi:hypothetical protein